MQYMCPEKAIQRILDNALVLQPDLATTGGVVRLYAEKFVRDVLDYCHRDDFPVALTFAAAELVAKWSTTQSQNGGVAAQNAPLKSIKQDDTEFVFAVDNVSSTGSMIEADWETVKPKLNLYRKLVSPRCRCHTPDAGRPCGNTCTTTP